MDIIHNIRRLYLQELSNRLTHLPQNTRSKSPGCLLHPGRECPDQGVRGQSCRQDDLATALRQDLFDDGFGHRLGRQNRLLKVLSSIRQWLDHGRANPDGMNHAATVSICRLQAN